MEFKKIAEQFSNKFQNKIIKFVAFWTAMTAFLAIIPTVIAIVYSLWTFGSHLYNLDSYVTDFTEVSKYLVFQVGQNTRRIDAEGDLKHAFGIPVRMTNPPKGGTEGDLWYTTYTKIGDKWYLVTYKAQPYLTDKEVHVFNYNGEWENAGNEIKPTKKDVKAN